jgi:hypothetical protein
VANYKLGTYYYVCDADIIAVPCSDIDHRITCEDICSTVWYQGPRGGIKYISSKHDDESVFPYVTNRKGYMKQFTRVKKQAKSFREVRKNLRAFLESLKKGA